MSYKMIIISILQLVALTPVYMFMHNPSRIQRNAFHPSHSLSMKLQTGIVGFPNVGEYMLFSACWLYQKITKEVYQILLYIKL